MPARTERGRAPRPRRLSGTGPAKRRFITAGVVLALAIGFVSLRVQLLWRDVSPLQRDPICRTQGQSPAGSGPPTTSSIETAHLPPFDTFGRQTAGNAVWRPKVPEGVYGAASPKVVLFP